MKMSSANEDMHPPLPAPQKSRVSPLEFRNTDLVSRLLAATPPYLYNMPLVPHTYFFSEMLRSFVQAKAENTAAARNLTANNTSAQNHQRRTRKRSWTNAAQQHYSSGAFLKDMPPPISCASTNWAPKMYLDKAPVHLLTDKPLELTMSSKQEREPKSCPESNVTTPMAPPAPSFGTGTDLGGAAGSEQGPMVLPPPPPLWYPPLYPPGGSYPSAFDPLHFFIDLRVSGHIYDRKGSAKDETPKEEPVPSSPLGYFKQSKHCSAFSVPNNNNGSSASASPMNLTAASSGNDTKTKFDVKSMGFEKNNRTSTNYIMQNIDGIYKSIASEADSTGTKKDIEDIQDKEKAKKDLRALIGLELVVDYMSGTKTQKRPSVSSDAVLVEDAAGVDDSTSRSCSPAVEVVSVNDNEHFAYN